MSDAESYDIDLDKYPLLIYGVRGFFDVGKPGNDRGIYDDVIVILSPYALVVYNANTDPSKFRKGSGRGAKKGMASLNPGFWPAYRFDWHRGRVLGYPALCQRVAPVTVTRDGDPPYEDTGMFGINIHRGGRTTTGSAGCQTIHPDQWISFYSTAKDQAMRVRGEFWCKMTVPYLLTTR